MGGYLGAQKELDHVFGHFWGFQDEIFYYKKEPDENILFWKFWTKIKIWFEGKNYATENFDFHSENHVFRSVLFYYSQKIAWVKWFFRKTIRAPSFKRFHVEIFLKDSIYMMCIMIFGISSKQKHNSCDQRRDPSNTTQKSLFQKRVTVCYIRSKR